LRPASNAALFDIFALARQSRAASEPRESTIAGFGQEFHASVGGSLAAGLTFPAVGNSPNQYVGFAPKNG
jgi:hypothetical protein